MRVVKPKKFLGQHFLKDLKVAQDIADTVDVCPEIPILEVGPGMGVLTQFLLPKERNVKVVELDYESVPTYGKPIRNWKTTSLRTTSSK